MTYSNRGGLVIEDGYWAAVGARRYVDNASQRISFNAVSVRPYRPPGCCGTLISWTDWGSRMVVDEMLLDMRRARA